MRTLSITLICSLTLVLLSFSSEVSATTNPRRPHVVIILADDMGLGDVTALNKYSQIPTPNLDKLARQSLSFTDAHAAGSYCVPSRYGLLTGRYMWRTRLGSGGNLANFAGTLIEPDRKTIANLLQNAGYYTGLIGKWHLGLDWKLRDQSEREQIRVDLNYQNFNNIDFASPALKGPKDYGFTYSFGTAGSAEMNPATFIENNRVTVIPTLTSAQAKAKYGEWYGRDDNIVAEDYTMDRLVPTLSNKACEFVETAVRTKPDQPFFLYYAMTTPHNPIVPHREFQGKSRAGTYGDFVFELDYHVGKLLQKLDDLGIVDNTLVIFTSDNGPVNRTKGYFQRWVRGDTMIYDHDSNGPCVGWKGGLEEGGHRVPFLVRWPAVIKPGEQCSTTIVFNDVFPTLAEILDIPLDDNIAEDGVSFYQALKGESRPVSFHKAIIHNHHNGTFAVRQGPYKLMVHGPKTIDEVLNESVTATYTLYDLGEDIEETTDISKQHPVQISQMLILLKQYVKTGRSKGS
ncbi:arylsulfatase [uncultured Rubinisphaera sp.]|uniref:sulfatase family protein n=1 Tax=uncultured Rubinisphaera sp. TaxID=1678686 RepID=UPI0030DCE4AD